MSRYDTLADNALALIRRMGALCAVTRTNSVLTDPVTQAKTETTNTMQFAVVGMPPGKSAEFRVGSLQGRSVIEFTAAPVDNVSVLMPGDKVSFGGQSYVVFWASHIKPDGLRTVISTAYAE